jgi:RNA polymerase-interacting CarD/CdnL/TRCF family regulator
MNEQKVPEKAPEQPLTAIQMIERDLMQRVQQREQAITQLHMFDGAIQSLQTLLQKLRTEEQKALAVTKQIVDEKVVEFTKSAGEKS